MMTLPLKCRAYLDRRSIQYTEIEQNGQKGIILRQHPLPAGRFDAAQADILILLPSSYPDAPPDMFYALPWLRLVEGSKYPRAADVSMSFMGQNWQRWSRHCNDWRAGIDGIWTMLKRVEAALEEAA